MIIRKPHGHYVPGNKIQPLFDSSVTPDRDHDDIFHQAWLAIEGARHSIQLEMFGFGMMDMAGALVQAHRRGVKVQVILDPPDQPIHEHEKREVVDYLESEGLEVLYYPVEQARGKYGQLQHGKMLIVDGDRAIVGGMNWCDRSGNNRDVNMLVEGPAVDEMETLFNQDFLFSGGCPKEMLPVQTTAPAGHSVVGLRATDEYERGVLEALSRAVDNADESILLEQMCITHDGLCERLTEAARRGVEVRVLLDPFQIGNTKLNEKCVKRLRECGVEVRWFEPDPELKNRLHAKLAIFDGRQAILGSANWSEAGMTYNREINVDILDQGACAEMTGAFEDDWRLGKPHPKYRY